MLKRKKNVSKLRKIPIRVYWERLRKIPNNVHNKWLRFKLLSNAILSFRLSSIFNRKVKPVTTKNIIAILKGVGIIALLHFLQVGLFIYLKQYGNQQEPFPDSTLVILLFGLIQWVYVIPAIFIGALKHHYWLVLGMVIFAVIILVVNIVFLKSVGMIGTLLIPVQ